MTLVVVLNWLKAHRRLVAEVLVVVAVFLAGYTAGHKNERVVEKTVVKTQVQDHIVYQDRVVVQKVYVQAKVQKKHVETTTEKKPDGTVITKTTSDTDTDTNTKVGSTKTDDKSEKKDEKVTQTENRTKTITNSLGWRISAGVGYSIPYGLGQGELGIPGMKGFVVQVGADRKVVGPFWLGIFGNTQGVVGLDLSAVF